MMTPINDQGCISTGTDVGKENHGDPKRERFQHGYAEHDAVGASHAGYE